MATGGQPRTDVAVVAPYAGSLYANRPVGGAELQSAYLVRALSSAGFSVAHVIRMHTGHQAVDLAEGIRLIPLAEGYDGSGIGRRLGGLRAANAGPYVQRSASMETAVVGAYARIARRRFVFSSSSVADFRLDPESTRVAGASLDDRKSLLQYRIGLKLADEVVVQTHDQQTLARERLGVRARVIQSFCEPAPEVEAEREAFL